MVEAGVAAGIWRTALAIIEADIRTVRNTDPAAPERREHPRHEVGYPARLTYGAVAHACTVIDMSVGGAQLALDVQIRPWTVATLLIENFGAFHCRVVWSRGGRLGLQFFDVARSVIRRAAAPG